MTKLEQMLTGAREIAVTDEEHLWFITKRASEAISAIRERIGEPLAACTLAYALDQKRLFIIDWTEPC